jgi:hypothetical protein
MEALLTNAIAAEKRKDWATFEKDVNSLQKQDGNDPAKLSNDAQQLLKNAPTDSSKQVATVLQSHGFPKVALDAGSVDPDALNKEIAATRSGFNGAQDPASAIATYKPRFEANDKNADTLLTDTINSATSDIAAVQKQIDAIVPPEKMAKLNSDLQKQYAAFAANATDADKQVLDNYGNAPSPAARTAAKAELAKKYPDLVKAIEAYETSVIPLSDKRQQQIQDLERVSRAVSIDFSAHANYADALLSSGQTDAAKAELTSAFKNLTLQERQQLLQDPKLGPLVTDLCKAVGLDISKVPAANLPDALKVALKKMGIQD